MSWHFWHQDIREAGQKNVPSALVVMEHGKIVQNDEKCNFISDDESEERIFNIVLD